jgi:peptidoglycan hydrolase-like protein with peptidoglycan-binding domain
VAELCGAREAVRRMSPYAFGTRSDETRRVQQALVDHGFDPGAIDGIFGRQTATAVVAAREAFALQGSGVDQALLARLGLLAANPLSGILAGLTRSLLLSTVKGLLPMTFLSGYKTYIVAGAMLITGIAGMLGVDIPTFTGQAPGNLVMEALAFFFLRQGLKTDASGN